MKVYVVYEWDAGEEPNILKVFQDGELAHCWVEKSNKNGVYGVYLRKHCVEMDVL